MNNEKLERRPFKLDCPPALPAKLRSCIVGFSICLVLFCGCVPTAAPRDNPFAIASAKLKQTFALDQQATDDQVQLQTSVSSDSHRQPVNPTPAIYQPPVANPVASQPHHFNAQAQRQQPLTSNAPSGSQAGPYANQISQSAAYRQQYHQPGRPHAMTNHSPYANQGQAMRVPANAQDYLRSQQQAVAQVGYYRDPQEKIYSNQQPESMPYIPLQYQAQEVPSQSTYFLPPPNTAPIENRQLVNPYRAHGQEPVSQQSAPAFAPGQSGFAPQNGMHYGQPGELHHEFYVDPVQHPSNAVLGTGTGNLVDGIGLRGSMLRQLDKTANEIALELTMQNELQREQLKQLNQNLKDLQQNLKDQKSITDKTKEQLTESKRLNASLRQDKAKLMVQIEGLENEKETIQKNSDAALRDIESQLDSMLMSTMSKVRRRPAGSRPK